MDDIARRMYPSVLRTSHMNERTKCDFNDVKREENHAADLGDRRRLQCLERAKRSTEPFTWCTVTICSLPC